MPEDFEDLVRAAHEAQAATAVDPDGIRAVLPERVNRIRTRRRTNAVLCGLALVVLVAVAAPRVLFDASPSTLEPGSPGYSGLGDSSGSGNEGMYQGVIGIGVNPGGPYSGPPQDPNPAVSLQDTFTWLPAGYTQRVYQAEGAGVLRSWQAAGQSTTPGPDQQKHGITLSVSGYTGSEAGRPQMIMNSSAVARINLGAANGSPVWCTCLPGNSLLEFQGPDGKNLEALDLDGLSNADLLRLAQSVRVDQTTRAMPIHFGWWPAEYLRASKWVQGDSPTDYTAETSSRYATGPSNYLVSAGVTMPPTGSPYADLDVTVNPPAGQIPEGGQTITINGLPARMVTQSVAGGYSSRWLVMTIGGQQVAVESTATNASAPPLTLADQERLIADISLVPNATDWIGTP